MESTDILISNLEKLDAKDEDYDEETNNHNMTVCRLLNIHLREFYDDIYIPFTHFRIAKWNIRKVLYENNDVLFYCQKFLTNEDHERFYQVFDKYVFMIEEIFSHDNKLVTFLKKWTDQSQAKWVSIKNNSYLKSILICSKYQYISPEYVTQLYLSCSNKHRGEPAKIKEVLENELDQLNKEIRKESKCFRQNYNDLIVSYVYEYPIFSDPAEKKIYTLAFMNSVIMEILNFAEKLVELNVYAIHPFVTNIIDFYTPIDQIGQHHAHENDGRKIIIV